MPSRNPGANRYRIPEGIIDRTIGDEILIHRFETDEVFVLNGDARLVFEALKQGRTHRAIREAVVAKVFGDTLDLYRAVDEVLGQMFDRGLIELEPAAAVSAR